MLVNCPKCNFSQPKDRYCAKCGVDMEAFKPVEIPAFNKFLLHPAFHISIIFILVFLAVVFIKTHRQQSFLEQIEKIPKGPAVLDNKQVENAPPPAPPSPVQSAANQPPPPPAPSLAKETSSAIPTEPLSSSSKLMAANKESTIPPPLNEARPRSRLKVYYAEIDTTTLSRWIPKMQATGQYSETDFKMGALPDIEKEMLSDKSIIIMDSVEKSFESPRGSLDWFVGRSTETNSSGFRTLVNIFDDRNLIKGEIKMNRLLEPRDPKLFEADFELPPKAGWVFWGLVGHNYNLDPDEAINPKSFFQIFKSARFKNLRTEFTMLFVFDTQASK